ncbi:putative thylakoid lumenal 15.0 kDa protein 2, chloroplastic [Sesbania bispinosa]|nr:putative thylakoid lumenal 15.0 kDa protein 2, chloroplastic [Sesbania bispinosa]
MEKYFGNAYRGDPGVPHAEPERFINIWVGSAAFSVLTYFNPYMWQLSNQFNWHDKAMLFEQYHWKKAKKKNQQYEFLISKMFLVGCKKPGQKKPTCPSSPVRTLLPKTLSCHLSSLPTPSYNTSNCNTWLTKIHSKSLHFALSGVLSLGLLFGGTGLAEAAKVGVNKPELLPKEFSTVIDVAGFLSDGQEKRLAQEISDLEKDTGYKLRVLAQNYPDTPGLAVRDFWQVDDRTVVFVADPTFGNILNFNVGASVDLDIPRSFWSRLAGKYGNIFYWREKGEDASIESAVMAISSCLREPIGPNNCSEVK